MLDKAPEVGDSAFIAVSREMRRIRDLARRAGKTDAKALITGESGVGKDVVAREIHASSPRVRKAFIAVNCAGLPENLLESELFGHVRGSFTGAYRDRLGKLQQADGGTLFLDEVGEMSPRMQAMLLRFLENGEIQIVGDTHGTRTRTVDVRVITATNRNLAERVASGHFREDLLYRLRVIHIAVPPLRERVDDIPALVEHTLGKTRPRLTCSSDAMRALTRYRWPGNVRELQNVVEQATWLADGSSNRRVRPTGEHPERSLRAGRHPRTTPPGRGSALRIARPEELYLLGGRLPALPQPRSDPTRHSGTGEPRPGGHPRELPGRR